MRSKVRTHPEQLEGIKAILRQSRTDGKSVEQIRKEMDAAAAMWPKVPGIRVQPVQSGPVRGEWLIPAGAVAQELDSTEGDNLQKEAGGGTGLVPCAEDSCEDYTAPTMTMDTRPLAKECPKQAILYFHGGGFTAGTCAFYRSLTSRIASVSRIPVLCMEYRLAPEHRYPAANDDCLAAYHWLLTEGLRPCDIVLGGDSVGASLALMTLLALRDAGEALPGGAFLISPHSDLVHLDGESYTSRAATDPTGSLEGNRRLFENYWGGQAGEPPAILSPLRMDLSRLPPILVQVGEQEVLLSDAERLAAQAKKAGTEVTLEVWEDMWCVFHILAHMLPEAQEAIDRIGDFVQGRLGGHE